MATMPRTTTQPPRRLPPSITLIGSSRTLIGDTEPDTGGPVRWEGGGVAFRSLPCGTFAPFLSDCDTVGPLEGERGESHDWDPLTLWAAEVCSSANTQDQRAAEARARELLLVDQHRQIEREFWKGTAAAGENPDAPNLWLAMDNTVTELSGGGESSPLVYALAALQEAVGPACGRGMIHATTTTATLWLAAGAIRREGGLLLDAFDNVIVPGVGYDGSAPDGTIDASGETAWAYATGLVDTRLGEVSFSWGVDRSNNDVTVIAQRQGLAAWDGCCHYGINVNLCLTGCGSA